MRDDVVGHLGGRHSAILLAQPAQWVCAQEPSRCTQPRIGVAALCACTTRAIGLQRMLLSMRVTAPAIGQHTASRVSARSLGCVGHEQQKTRGFGLAGSLGTASGIAGSGL